MKINREIKIGVFFVAIILLFLLGINFLKGKNLLRHHRTFYAVYKDVSGLENAAPVTVNGYKVGMISQIGLISSANPKILVELTINDPVKIPSNSIARIISPDLLGTKSIQIVLGNSAVMASDKDSLQTDTQLTLSEEVSKQVAPLKNKAENLMLSLDTILVSFQAVFNRNSRENLTSSFEHIRQTIINLENTTFHIDTLVYGQRKRMERILFNVEDISTTIRQNDDKINNILSNFSKISDTLAKVKVAQTISNLNTALSGVNMAIDKINSGKGSLGLLINDPKIYNNLEASSTELNLLVQDLKLHPYRYVNFSVFPPRGKHMNYTTPESSKPVEISK